MTDPIFDAIDFCDGCDVAVRAGRVLYFSTRSRRQLESFGGKILYQLCSRCADEERLKRIGEVDDSELIQKIDEMIYGDARTST